MVWAAGVAASPLGAALGAPLDRAGRVLVKPDLTVPGHPEVFVIGDLRLAQRSRRRAAARRGAGGDADGQHARAANILRAIERPAARAPFRYRDHGNMATIGREAAVADIGGLRLSGFVAWLAWLFVHILIPDRLPQPRPGGVAVAWSYLTFQRGARLITEAAR